MIHLISLKFSNFLLNKDDLINEASFLVHKSSVLINGRVNLPSSKSFPIFSLFEALFPCNPIDRHLIEIQFLKSKQN